MTPIIVYKNKIITNTVTVEEGWEARVNKVNVGYGIVLALTIVICIVAAILYLLLGKQLYKLRTVNAQL